MEFQDVSERMDWEARRVAAAFEVGEFMPSPYNSTTTDFRAKLLGKEVWWTIDARPEKTTLRMFVISEGGLICQVALTDVLGESDADDEWSLFSLGRSHDLMARALYRLGFEDAGILSQLPQLSEHEKLELRLSMPREFWPQKWLDENVSK